MARLEDPLQERDVFLQSHQRQRRLRLSSWLLLLFSLLLLGGSVYLGILAYQQIRFLETNVQVSENIINANVRTLSQVQRELLRLLFLLESGENDPDALNLQRAFVAQRVQEASNSYQLQTLSSDELLAEARTLAAHWEEEVQPLILAIQADPADDDLAMRNQAMAQIVELERAYNNLVAQGENNRRVQASRVNDATLNVLNSERILLYGLGLTTVLFFGFMVVTGVYYYRFDSEREASAWQLGELNAELRKLSQVASRTDNLVAITDDVGRLEWVNKAFEQRTGYANSECIGQPLLYLLKGPATDADMLAVVAADMKQGKGCNHCETFAYTRDGRSFWTRLELQPTFDEHNQVSNFIAVMTDLSVQRERELTIAHNSQLLDVINRAQNEFILTKTPPDLFSDLLGNLLELTESEYGLIGEVMHDGDGTPSLTAHALRVPAPRASANGGRESREDAPLAEDVLNVLFEPALRSQQPLITNKPTQNMWPGEMPPEFAQISSFLGVPFFNANQEMVGLIGIANRPDGYDEQLVSFLQPFLATCGNLIEAYRNEQRRQETAAELILLNEQLERRSEELTDQRDFALQIMNNMGQGLTVTDEMGLFTYVNPAYAAIVGELAENMIGRSPLEFTSDDTMPALQEARAKREAGQINTYETTLERADGACIDVLITGVPRFRQGNFIGTIAVITDLTGQKQVESALRASIAEARKLSEVASRTDNMVIIADASGAVEWVNDAFTRVTGYTLAEVAGSRPGSFLQGPDTDPEVVAFMRHCIREGVAFKTTILNYAKNGNAYWVEIELQPVFDDQQKLTNFIAIETDITTRRQAEDRLREAKETAEQAVRAKAAFLASMSHEIRTPLNAVIGLNSLLLNTELTEQQHQYAMTARNSGNLLLMLINNVLDYSALESGRIELDRQDFSPHASIQELLDLLRHDAAQKGLSLTCNFDPSLPAVLVGDETKLRQVLLNLIGNGLKFTEQGGVHVEVRAQPLGEQVRLFFKVIDSGIGIPAEKLAMLFQPFSQLDPATPRKYGGSGLGLAISKVIVNLMSGDITVSSEKNSGTTFQFSVVLDVASTQTLLSSRLDSQDLHQMAQNVSLRILLVEDDTVNQQVGLHMLELLGYRPDLANNGLEALAALRQRRYDVVFMDVNMPVMDGITATKRIRQELAAEDTPYIVAMTASALEGDRERFIAAGMDDYVSKPVRSEMIYAALQRAIDHQDIAAIVAAPETGVATPVSEAMIAPIDLGSFQERLGHGQEALLWQLVSLFIEEAEKVLPQLAAAIVAADAERVRAHAHHLKGSAAGAAALPFSATAGQLEQQAQQGALATAPQLLKAMAGQLAQVITWRQANSTLAQVDS